MIGQPANLLSNWGYADGERDQQSNLIRPIRRFPGRTGVAGRETEAVPVRFRLGAGHYRDVPLVRQLPLRFGLGKGTQ